MCVCVRGQFWGVGSLLLPCRPWDETQVTRFGSKHLHLLSPSHLEIATGNFKT